VLHQGTIRHYYYHTKKDIKKVSQTTYQLEAFEMQVIRQILAIRLTMGGKENEKICFGTDRCQQEFTIKREMQEIKMFWSHSHRARRKQIFGFEKRFLKIEKRKTESSLDG